MKKKLVNFIENNKQLCLTTCIVIIIGIIGIIIYFTMTNNLITRNYDSSKYSFSYDKSWFITERSSLSVELKHEKSKMRIEIIEDRIENLEEFLDKTIWTINSNNSNYKLISKNKILATINNYEGYRLIYEDSDNHALIILAKKGNTLMLATYIASNDSFDLLYDSANYIINSWTIKNETLEIENLIDLKLSNIKWNDNKNLTIDEDDINNYEIDNVKYTLSTAFISDGKDHEYKCVNLTLGEIKANVFIQNINVYEYLDKTSQNSIYYKIEKYNDDTIYNSFKSQTSRIESLKDDYIYKASWKIIATEEIHEEVHVIYALDKNHILLIKINSTNAYIPKELVQGIKIVK